MFWSCPNISTYWTKIFQTLSEVLQKQLKPDTILAVFGVKVATTELSNKQYVLICFVTLLAQRLILLNWKQKNPPTHSTLLTDVMKHLQLAKCEHVQCDMATVY